MNKEYQLQRRITMDDYYAAEFIGGIYASLFRLDKSIDSHWHDHFEFEYVISGKGYQIINQNRYEFSPGMLFITTQTDFHEIIIEEAAEFIKIDFQESCVDSFVLSLLLGLGSRSPLKFSVEEKKLFDMLFESILCTKKLYSESQYAVVTMKNLLESLILNIVNHSNTVQSKNSDSNLTEKNDMHRILVYIHQNFNKQISLKSVAKASHFSSPYLSKLFHQTMGVTFKDYVTNLQMNYASKLILNTDKSITDICFEAGFGSLSNFIREFKKFYSISPSQYRANKDFSLSD